MIIKNINNVPRNFPHIPLPVITLPKGNHDSSITINFACFWTLETWNYIIYTFLPLFYVACIFERSFYIVLYVSVFFFISVQYSTLWIYRSLYYTNFLNKLSTFNISICSLFTLSSTHWTLVFYPHFSTHMYTFLIINLTSWQDLILLFSFSTFKYFFWFLLHTYSVVFFHTFLQFCLSPLLTSPPVSLPLL